MDFKTQCERVSYMFGYFKDVCFRLILKTMTCSGIIYPERKVGLHDICFVSYKLGRGQVFTGFSWMTAALLANRLLGVLKPRSNTCDSTSWRKCRGGFFAMSSSEIFKYGISCSDVIFPRRIFRWSGKRLIRCSPLAFGNTAPLKRLRPSPGISQTS